LPSATQWQTKHNVQTILQQRTHDATKEEIVEIVSIIYFVLMLYNEKHLRAKDQATSSVSARSTLGGGGQQVIRIGRKLRGPFVVAVGVSCDTCFIYIWFWWLVGVANNSRLGGAGCVVMTGGLHWRNKSDAWFLNAIPVTG
jgi:hypothetical protein